MEAVSEQKKIEEFRKKVLEIMSHRGYPVGSLNISYNSFTGSVKILVQRSERLENKTVTISEVL